MAVVTTDILLEGIRRDDVFAWLAVRDNHKRVLDGAFDAHTETAPGDYDLLVRSGGRARVLEYRFDAPDDSFGGRRVLVRTGGKRFTGQLHWSLRTLKPSTNTLVTLHIDYDPGDLLGQLVDRAGLRDRLDAALKSALENLGRVLPR